MKKLYMFFIAASLISVTGCKKFLTEETRGALLGGDALKSQAGLEAALTGSYAGWENTFNTGFIHATAIAATMGGDDVTTHKASNKSDLREFDQFNVSVDNQRTKALYIGCYKAIQGANNVIANYKTTVGDASVINAIAGEAYFMRAVSYYWLVRLYGTIPMVTDPNYSDKLLTIKRSSTAEVYKLIEADLTAAEGLVPDTKRDPGRPNKGSVKAYLADVYLTEAGWPLKDASKYAMAAAKAKEVIDNKDLYGFQLLPSYDQVWENDPAKNGTAEAVFQISTFDGVGSTTNCNYGWSAMPGEEGGWDDFFAEKKFFEDFPAGPRKDATFRTVFKKGDGTTMPWQDSQTKRPYYHKYYIKGDIGNYTSSVPESMMRYAYVLTVYAEAEARATGAPDQLAYDCINAIRKRAGLTPLSGLSGPDFAAAVVQERAWEFAAERTRWFDLVRLEMVEQANSKANKDPDELKPIPTTISKANYTFPLPSIETSVNPNL